MTERADDLMRQLKRAAAASKNTRPSLNAPQGAALAKTPYAVPGLPPIYQLALMRSELPPPERILFIRPDSYGDLVLFAPVLEAIQAAFPRSRIGVLARRTHLDIAPLLPPGLAWLGFTGDPFRDAIDADSDRIAVIESTVREFAPDLVVAACFNKTWLEAVAAVAAPAARRLSLGAVLFDPSIDRWLAEHSTSATSLYPEIVDVPASLPEIEKNRRLLAHLTGLDVGPLRPALAIPEQARAQAASFLAGQRLARGRFLLCAPAGTAHVALKSWPAERFAAVLADVAERHKIQVLVVGSASESETTATVERLATEKGVKVTTWNGKPGEIAVLAALAEASSLYLGNDTGAMHIAAACNKPVVAVFGGGTWPRFQPVTSTGVLFVHPLPCFGCLWECHLGNAPCIQLIDTEVVGKHLSSFIAQSKRNRQLEVVAVDRLSPPLHESIGASRQMFESIQHDRDERLRQILKLTAIAHQHEAAVRESTEAKAIAELQLSGLEQTRSELASVRARSEELTSALAASEQATANAAAAVADLTRRLEELQRESAARETTDTETQGRLRGMETELAQQHAALEQMRTELEHAHSLRRTLEADLAAARATACDLELTRAELEKALENRRSETIHTLALAEARAVELARLGTATADRVRQSESLRCELAEVRKEKLRLEDVIARVEPGCEHFHAPNNCAVIESERLAVAAQLAQADQREKELASELLDRERTIRELGDSLTQSQEHAASLTTRLHTLEDECGSLRDQLQTVTEAARTAASHAALLESQRSALATELEAGRRSAVEQRTQADQREKELTSQLLAREATIRELGDSLTQSQEQVANLTTRLRNVEEACSSLQDQLQTVTEAARGAASHAAFLESQRSALLTELESERQSAVAQLSQADRREKELASQCASLRDQLQTVTEAARGAASHAAFLEGQRSALATELESERQSGVEQHAQADRREQALSARLAARDERLRELEEILSQLQLRLEGTQRALSELESTSAVRLGRRLRLVPPRSASSEKCPV